MPRRSIVSSLPVAWPTSTGSDQVSHALRAALCSCVVGFVDQVMIHVGLEEEVARLRQEKEQLGRELAGALEASRRAGQELGQRDRELSGIARCLCYLLLTALV